VTKALAHDHCRDASPVQLRGVRVPESVQGIAGRPAPSSLSSLNRRKRWRGATGPQAAVANIQSAGCRFESYAAHQLWIPPSVIHLCSY
jgi:hypothetical protein